MPGCFYWWFSSVSTQVSHAHKWFVIMTQIMFFGFHIVINNRETLLFVLLLVFLPHLFFHVLPRIPRGLLWSCPTWSVSPTFRSLCCLDACWPSLWSAPLAKPFGRASMATMLGTWISTVRVPTAYAAHLIPHILSHLFISAYFFVILSS